MDFISKADLSSDLKSYEHPLNLNYLCRLLSNKVSHEEVAGMELWDMLY